MRYFTVRVLYIRVGVTVTLCTHALNVLNEIMKRVYVSNREP